MKKLIFITLALLFILNTPLSWPAKPDNKDKEAAQILFSPSMLIEEVIRTTKEYARLKGKNLEEFFIENVSYERTNDIWDVFFQGKVVAPGNHFSITINDSDKELKLLAGE
ncbi:MAG: hypothetical protein JW867_08330 [Candidatus Omnitrophica bacterium]|nr:hypothetical protein [Candidatus Omnitrophota bacterium]